MPSKKNIARLKDPKFYLENFCKIKGKTPGLIPFILNQAQRDLYNAMRKFNRVIILKARQIGFCLHEDTKVLMADLTWRKIKEVEVGDEVVAIDENIPAKKKQRKMKIARVEKTFSFESETLKLTFSDGREIIATSEHKLLSKKWECSTDTIWRKVSDMKVGTSVRSITELWGEADYEDGWVQVVKIEKYGKAKVVDLQTSCSTYIAEGIVSHNSTAVTGYFYHKTITTPGTNTALIGYNSDLTAELLDKVKTFYKTTPAEFRPTIHYNSKYEISFPAIDSKILVLPSTENVGRGYTINNCLVAGTKIEMSDNSVKNIEDIVVGDKIINGDGGYSEVKGTRSLVPKNRIFRMKAYGFDDLMATEDHLVLTRGDGWKKMSDIKNTDYVAYPYSQVKNRRKTIKIEKHIVDGYETRSLGKVYSCKEEKYEGMVYDIGLLEEPHSILTTAGIVHNCLVTELSAWEKAEEKMMVLEASVPITGNLVVESTPRGQGNLYHRMWMSDNDYLKKEYGWWWMYSREEIEIIRRRMNDARRFAQEYGLEFLSSGRNVFDSDIITAQRQNQWREGETHTDANGETYFIKVVDSLRIYHEPEEDGLYVIGADVSEGVTGGDYSVAVVWNRKTGEEVAMYRGHMPPDRFGEMLNRWGRKYNDAFMVVEINNHGLTTITILKQLLYPTLYFRPRQHDSMAMNTSDKIGWKTTKVTRPLLIDEFAQAVRERSLTIHSKELLDEMTVFIYDDTGNMVASEGFHDDCIFAAGIGLQGFKILYDKKLEQVDYTKYLPKTFAY